jgi:hypothetical protein
MEYFDYETAAVRRDYPHDEMLFELHVMRACRAIRDGAVSLAEILRPKAHA